jgi:ribosomal protein S18 acetylase RimI-like enzyme
VQLRSVEIRPATAGDATVIGALAMQVFLHTYARDGVRPDLAREAINCCGPAHYAQRLAAGAALLLAEDGDGLLGFAEWDRRTTRAPGQTQQGCELVRLYVQPTAHRRGLGARLLAAAESDCRAAGAPAMWLTAWAENAHALAFYRSQGYADVGTSEYWFENRCYENRVFVKVF